jgi:CheY-like chemotaxis protein
MAGIFFGSSMYIYTEDEQPHYHSRGNNKRILIVDDERLIANAFKCGLEALGTAAGDITEAKEFPIVVDTFNDPEEALSQYRAGNYVLIILDIRMPNIDGFHLARKIWQIDNEARICFLTAYAIYEDEAKRVFPKLRDYCFIQKPIRISELIRIIKQRLSHR